MPARQIHSICRLIVLLLAVLPIACAEESPAERSCNGSPELCDRAFNEVVFLTTHNAYNYAAGGPVEYQGPNQDLPITRQLEFGVRAFMLDVYPDPSAGPDNPGIPWVYHVFPIFGHEPLTRSLDEISDFLAANPDEVITLILECYTEVAGIEAALAESGLLDQVYTHDANLGWPTLGQMIEQGTNLLVLSDCGDNEGRGWYHYVWDLAVETPFSNSSRSDFSCDFQRGDPANDLFILNHFLTTPDLGLGSPDSSVLANQADFILERSGFCEDLTGKIPNFLTVDFYALGQTHEALMRLNGLN